MLTCTCAQAESSSLEVWSYPHPVPDCLWALSGKKGEKSIHLNPEVRQLAGLSLLKQSSSAPLHHPLPPPASLLPHLPHCILSLTITLPAPTGCLSPQASHLPPWGSKPCSRVNTPKLLPEDCLTGILLQKHVAPPPPPPVPEQPHPSHCPSVGRPDAQVLWPLCRHST